MEGLGVKNDKSDVEMKLPFFFYNLNTLSSHAATTTDAVGWYDTSFHISHSHPSQQQQNKIETRKDNDFFFFLSFSTTRHAVYISLLPCYRILSHLTLYIFFHFFLTCLYIYCDFTKPIFQNHFFTITYIHTT